MNIKGSRTIILMFMMAILFTSCSISIPGVVREEFKMGNIDYKIIETSSKEFSELNTGEFKKWYEGNYKNGGVYNFSKDGIRYILIGAGERLSSGYAMKDIEINGKKDEIEVNAKLHGPKEGEAVQQIVTYPHVIISIKEDGRKLVCSGVELQVNSKKVEFKKDSGRLAELMEGSIKVNISGTPDEIGPKEFKLDDRMKENIGSMDLKKGMEIIFTYYLDENEQPVVVEVNRM